MTKKKTLTKILIGIAICLIFLVCLCLLASIFALVGIKLTVNPKLTVIDGRSMNPTLQNGEYVITVGSKFTYSPKQGDIVVAHGDFEGDDFDKPIVKRVIATGGQTVRIEFEESTLVKARVYVDGELIDTPSAFYDSSYDSRYFSSALAQYEYYYLGYYENGTHREVYCEYYDYSTKVFELTVPKGTVFLMGDNRYNSADSRIPEIGCVPEKYILGKAILRVLPFSKFGSLYE